MLLVGLSLHSVGQLLVLESEMIDLLPQHVDLLLQALLLVGERRIDSGKGQSTLLLSGHQIIDEFAAILVQGSEVHLTLGLRVRFRLRLAVWLLNRGHLHLFGLRLRRVIGAHVHAWRLAAESNAALRILELLLES